MKFFADKWRGLWNYYSACNNAANLRKAHYLLKYSCARTLRMKRNEKLKRYKKVFRKYGKHLTVRDNEGNILTQFFTHSCKKKARFSQKHSGGINPIEYIGKLDFRTFRGVSILNSACYSCGSTERVEVQHVRKLEDLKGKDFLHKRIGAISRKQVPLCSACHRKVHAGTYDGPSLKNWKP